MDDVEAKVSGIHFGNVGGETLFSFAMSIGDNEKRYPFNSKKGAARGRAIMIKQLKADGVKIIC